MIGLVESVRSGKTRSNSLGIKPYFENGAFSGALVEMDRYSLLLHSEQIQPIRWNEIDPNDLPDCTEWNIILDNLVDIDKVMKDNGGEQLSGHLYWTGSEDGENTAWVVGTIGRRHGFRKFSKISRFPFRTCERIAW
jgi:hypothetical protein